MGMSPRLLRPRATGFNPKNISGLIGWYDSADLSAMAQNTNGTGAVTEGTQVGYWADKSGSGNHLTQGTAANRPTLTANQVNGKTALRFDGSNDFLQRSAYTAQTSLAGLTRIMVFSSSQLCMATRTMTTGLVEAGGGQCFFTPAADTVLRCSINSFNLDSSRSGSGVDLKVYSSVYDGSAGTLRTFYDGTQVASATGAPSSTSATAGANLWIGANVGLNNFVLGPIAEYIIYSRALSASERSAVESALRKKWGFA